MTMNEWDTDDGSIELHTSAPAVELANDAARKARCKECNHCGWPKIEFMELLERGR